MRPGEGDRADVRIAVCAIDQPFELLGHLWVEQCVRAAVEASDEDAGAAFDGDVSCELLRDLLMWSSGEVAVVGGFRRSGGSLSA